MNDIELVPNPSALIEATRSIGYSIETAIADLIDNSITAQATNIWIEFNAENNSPFVMIVDNGVGMDFNTLKNAMKYGTQDPVNTRDKRDLGRFGLGLKTASMSQCRKLSVISKQNGTICGLTWDIDYIRKSSRWAAIVLEPSISENYISNSPISTLPTGTIVVWENLDRLTEGSSETAINVLSRKIMDVRFHCSLVFHRYLEKKEKGVPNLDIYINKSVIEPHDPFMIGYSQKVNDDEYIKIPLGKVDGKINEATVVLTPYILPFPTTMPSDLLSKYTEHESFRTSQGFYVYRNYRLIIWGTWFRLLKQHDTYKLARVKVDIPNSIDFLWSIDIKKSTATPPFILRDHLKKMIEHISRFSSQKFRYRERIEESGDTLHAWLREKTHNGIEYKINTNHPILKYLSSSMNEEQQAKLALFLKNVELNIPINSIFVDYADDAKISNVFDTKFDEIKGLAIQYLSDCETEYDVEVAIELMRKLDLFSGKNELLEEIKKEAMQCLET